MRAPRILVLSAAIGEGHDLPARWLAAGLREEAPGAEVSIVDGLAAMSEFLERLAMSGSGFESAWGNRLYDLEHWLLTKLAPTRAFAGWGLEAIGGSGLLRLIARERPDAVVSTYPGVTEPLGRLRAAGRLGVPVVSAITDLASLLFWAHPGVDLHLVTHPESVEEVRAIAGADTAVVPVRGLNDPAFLADFDPAAARARLGLPAAAPVVVVSGAALRGPTARPRPRLHRRPARPVRGRRRADPLDRRADRARSARAWLPDDLLRLGPRPHPRQQRRLPALRAGRGRPTTSRPRARARPRARRPPPTRRLIPRAAHRRRGRAGADRPGAGRRRPARRRGRRRRQW